MALTYIILTIEPDVFVFCIFTFLVHSLLSLPNKVIGWVGNVTCVEYGVKTQTF